MHSSDRIEYLKRKIKRAYKRYIGERTDEEATITDVANYFNIPIDKERIEDYTITKFDYSIPSIELVDKKNEITYTSNYTDNADLLNYSGGGVRFNSLISTSPVRKVERLYYIEDKTPIITKMTFKDNDYELVFEKEIPNNIGFFTNKGIRFTIGYLKNMNHEGRIVQQLLLSQIFENCYIDDQFIGTFEQLFTYGPNTYIKRDDTQDKYIYVRDNNVIYGINNFEQKGVCHLLNGICFESVDIAKIDRYFPICSNMDIENYPLVKDKQINSAMIFVGSTGDGIHHFLEIYKSDSITKIKYYARESIYSKGSDGYRYIQRKTLVKGTIAIPVLSKGNISSEEIRNIIDALQIRYGNDDFIQIISKDLETFGTKIDIKNGIVQEELDKLSPKLFIDKDFDEICNLIASNKEEYFSLVSKQFYNATNIAKAKKEEKSKVLTLNGIN